MNLISIIKAVAGMSWLVVLGAVAYAVIRASRGQKIRGGVAMVVVVVLVAVVLNIAAAGLEFIEPNERGVVITVASGGVRPEPLWASITKRLL